jgi:hypothetical protein
VLRELLFKVAVTLEHAAGRLIVVSGGGLTGRGTHYFAEGWIQFGSAATYEVRTILGSSAEVGGQLTLTLNAPLSYAVATDVGTLYPGCDGRDVTCASKFGNFLNWGGHRIPLRNLTLNALNISAGAGGKK